MCGAPGRHDGGNHSGQGATAQGLHRELQAHRTRQRSPWGSSGPVGAAALLGDGAAGILGRAVDARRSSSPSSASRWWPTPSSKLSQPHLAHGLGLRARRGSRSARAPASSPAGRCSAPTRRSDAGSGDRDRPLRLAVPRRHRRSCTRASGSWHRGHRPRHRRRARLRRRSTSSRARCSSSEIVGVILVTLLSLDDPRRAGHRRRRRTARRFNAALPGAAGGRHGRRHDRIGGGVRLPRLRRLRGRRRAGGGDPEPAPGDPPCDQDRHRRRGRLLPADHRVLSRSATGPRTPG